MPVEAVLLTPGAFDFEVLRQVGETVNPPLNVAESESGGYVVFSDFAGEPQLTLGRARVVQNLSDLTRLVGTEAPVPLNTTAMYEGFIHYYDFQKGSALHVLLALEEIAHGSLIVRGITL